MTGAGNKAHISLEAIERAMKQVRKPKRGQEHATNDGGKAVLGNDLFTGGDEWGTAELPPPTTPLVNTMDHPSLTTFTMKQSLSHLYPKAYSNSSRFPLDNLEPPSEEMKTDAHSVKPVDTLPKKTSNQT